MTNTTKNRNTPIVESWCDATNPTTFRKIRHDAKYLEFSWNGYKFLNNINAVHDAPGCIKMSQTIIGKPGIYYDEKCNDITLYVGSATCPPAWLHIDELPELFQWLDKYIPDWEELYIIPGLSGTYKFTMTDYTKGELYDLIKRENAWNGLTEFLDNDNY